MRILSFFFIAALELFSKNGYAAPVCPQAFMDKAKWDGTDVIDGMPLNEAMCAQMPAMVCCKEYYEHQMGSRPKRKHIAPADLAAFPAKAPGMESYKALGYCTGDLKQETEEVAAADGTKKIKPIKVRRYELVAENSKGYFQLNIKDCPSLNHANILDRKRPIASPPLFFQNGEVAEITVVNKSNEDTAIHWHGLLLENDADGVPGVTQDPIAPGGTYKYRFHIIQDGTYWYHPHTLQEQDARGAFIIFPKNIEPIFANPVVDTRYQYDRTIILTDYINVNTKKVLARLQQDSGNMQLDGKLYNDLWTAFKTDHGKGLLQAFQNLKSMGMFSMDKADIYYSDFFINDERCLNCKRQEPSLKAQSQLEFGSIRAGERMRLRIINGSSSSYFYLDYANNKSLPDEQKLPMVIVAKDGKNVKPLEVDQLYMGMGECYDVIIEVPDNKVAYEFRLKSIDDQLGKRISRVLIGSRDDNTKIQEARDVPITTFGKLPNEKYLQVSYDMLKSMGSAPIDPEIPVKYYEFALMGNMENYYWQIKGVNGTKLDTKSAMPMLEIPSNTRIHVTVHNSMKLGMMNHPIHLHGQFFRLIGKNEKLEDVADRPFMHSATVFPGSTLELEFYSGATGTWMFHCHNVYHMANSMMMAFVVKPSDGMNHGGMNHGNMNHGGMNHGNMPQMKMKTEGIASMAADVGVGPFSQTAHFNYINPSGNSHLNQIEGDFERMSKDGNVIVDAHGAYNYCRVPNQCVTLNFDFHQYLKDGKTIEKSMAPGVGYVIKPLNSKLLVASVSVYTNKEIKGKVSSEIAVAPKTTFTGSVGCEGVYCRDFAADFAVTIRPKMNIEVVPVRCGFRPKEGGTYCDAALKVRFGPIFHRKH